MSEYIHIQKAVDTFRTIVTNRGIRSYCLLGCYIIKEVLTSKNVETKIISGYVIVDDMYYVNHYWLKVFTDNTYKKIDCTNIEKLAKFSNTTLQYTTTLNNKWESVADQPEEFKDIRQLIELYNLIQTNDKQKIKNLFEKTYSPNMKKAWRKIFFDLENTDFFRENLKELKEIIL